MRKLLSRLEIFCNAKTILNCICFFWLLLVFMHMTVPLMFLVLHLISFVAIEKYRIYYDCKKPTRSEFDCWSVVFRVIVDLLEWNSGWRPQKLFIQLGVDFFLEGKLPIAIFHCYVYVQQKCIYPIREKYKLPTSYQLSTFTSRVQVCIGIFICENLFLKILSTSPKLQQFWQIWILIYLYYRIFKLYCWFIGK